MQNTQNMQMHPYQQVCNEVRDFIIQGCVIDADREWMILRIREIIRERLKRTSPMDICLKNAHDCGATDGTDNLELCVCMNGRIFGDGRLKNSRALHGNAHGSLPEYATFCQTQLRDNVCTEPACKYNHIREKYFVRPI